MIQLFINNVAVDLPIGVTLQREYENLLFAGKEEAADFTIPVDLPLTDRLNAALNYPGFLGMAEAAENFPGRLIVDGVWVSNVVVKLLKCSQAKGMVSVSLIGSYGTLAADFGDKKVNDLMMGGKVYMAVTAGSLEKVIESGYLEVWYKSSGFAEFMKETIDPSSTAPFTFPQALDMQTDRSEEDSYNCINIYDVSRNRFADATLQNILQDGPREDKLAGESARGKAWWWVPQFFLHLVLKACFEETGYTISGGIFADQKFKRVLVHNTYAINSAKVENIVGANDRYNVTCTTDSITPSNHLPSNRILDFVTEIAKAHNLQIEIDTLAKAVQLISVNEILDSVAVDLSAKADIQVELNYEKAAFQRGFKLGWEYGDGDTLCDEVKEDFGGNFYRGQVAHLRDIGIFSGTGDGDIVYVGADNSFYQKEGADWVFWGMNLGPYKSSDLQDLEEVQCRAAPMQMLRKTIWYISRADGGGINDWHRFQNNYAVPVSNRGMCGKDLLVVPLKNQPANQTSYDIKPVLQIVSIAALETQNAIRLYNWIGMAPNPESASGAAWASGVNYTPMASPNAHDANGYWYPDDLRALVWRVPGLSNDMVQDFWARWAAQLRGGKTIEVDIVMDVVTYSQIKLDQLKVRLWELEWLVQKAQVLMPFPNLTKLTLVRV